MADEQDREGNTQEAPRGAPEGPGRHARWTSTARSCMLAAVIALSAFGPGDVPAHGRGHASGILALIKDPSVVDRKGIGELFMHGRRPRRSPAPRRSCSSARSPASLANVVQVGFKPSPKALKPDFKKLNPMTGLKNMFSPNSAVEAVKSGAQDRRRRRDRRARRCSRSSTRWPGWSACRAAGAPPDLRDAGPADRPARRVRLPGDRRRRLLLAAPPLREEPARWTRRRSSRSTSGRSSRTRSRARSAAARWSSPAPA